MTRVNGYTVDNELEQPVTYYRLMRRTVGPYTGLNRDDDFIAVINQPHDPGDARDAWLVMNSASPTRRTCSSIRRVAATRSAFARARPRRQTARGRLVKPAGRQ